MEDGEDRQVQVTYRAQLGGRLAPLYVRLRKGALIATVDGVHELIARVGTLASSASPLEGHSST